MVDQDRVMSERPRVRALQFRFAVQVIVATALIGLVSTRAFGQDANTAAASSAAGVDKYLSLRESTDRLTQKVAERYFNLVKLQEWSDASGKFKTLAKYVAHDPSLGWVDLSASRGSGAQRQSRVVRVPVAKLSKTCQSRVKQIATLQTKLDELAAKGPANDAAGQMASGALEGGERGAPMVDERGVEPSELGQIGSDRALQANASVAYETRMEQAASPPMDVPVEGEDDPDPLGFGELSAGLVPGPDTASFAATPPGAPPSAASPPVAPPAAEAASENESSLGPLPPPPPLQVPGAIAASVEATGAATEVPPQFATPGSPVGNADPAEWATNFDAFRANFVSDPATGQLSWGHLNALRTMGETEPIGKDVTEEIAKAAQARAAEQSGTVGEVRWEATFGGMQPAEGRLLLLLEVPQLPPPLSIEFWLDRSNRAAAVAWSQFSRGDVVSFTGRFTMADPTTIIVHALDPKLVRGTTDRGARPNR
jgi:hypothetical protein